MPPKTKREMSERILAMEEAFMTPLLPYKQYITEHGQHSVGRTGGATAHFYAQYEFPQQQISVSLIHGPMFHCDLDRPYEWRVRRMYVSKDAPTYVWAEKAWHDERSDTLIEEPEGYRTEEELYILLTKILGGSYGIQK